MLEIIIFCSVVCLHSEGHLKRSIYQISAFSGGTAFVVVANETHRTLCWIWIMLDNECVFFSD